MINIIKQEITIEESLKQRLEFICEFSHTTPTFINGFIHKVDKTNLSYIEPHRVLIKNITLLVFNYSNDVYKRFPSMYIGGFPILFIICIVILSKYNILV